MLEIKHISKQYVTGELVQNALSDVSLTLRDNEFVSILGPSGSGKTTLLNIIGGLDRYDEGDLVVDGVSTKRFTDRNWDAYRNHTIGFVFQSYNLIPHQSILSNVELALTIGGISKGERRKRAQEALEKVGLGGQFHKRPNQLSGGQMQRVAIARALVGDPSILLADEPTGALDTETSVQIMELLKEVAKDRLVVMVTHNPELAELYSTRIVKLRDGKIISDSAPCLDETPVRTQKQDKKAKMSLLTALQLSFNNLRTKRGRTFLTSLAGSIGIIGISLILALSSGVNNYIADIQKETMTSYPIELNSTSYDLSAMTGGMSFSRPNKNHDDTKIYSDSSALTQRRQLIAKNNLSAFKNYLDDTTSEIHNYVGENGIIYSYNVSFTVWSYNADGIAVPSNASTSGTGFGNSTSSTNFTALMKGTNSAISAVTTDSYELLSGSWATNVNELTLFLDENNSIPITSLYQLGFITRAEYDEVANSAKEGGEVKEFSFSYDSVIGKSYYLVPACDRYEEQDGKFHALTSEQAERFLPNAIELKVVGIVKPVSGSANANVSSAMGYTSALTDLIIAHTNESAIVKAQEANPDTNVLNGFPFVCDTDEKKADVAKQYLSALGISDKANAYTKYVAKTDLTELERANALDLWLLSPDEKILLAVYKASITETTLEANLSEFGKVSYDAPSSISIYADSFEAKNALTDCIARYNEKADESDRITYTDYVGLMTSSLTTIVNVISYVLIAFVAVSLVVSSLMIGIITHISVLERTKEIGILRSLGASKKNISEVFNAETIIIGFCAGVLGVGISVLLTFPINALIAIFAGANTARAVLPVGYALVLIAISVVITLVGGLIPAKKAAKKDPVLALRSEG